VIKKDDLEEKKGTTQTSEANSNGRHSQKKGKRKEETKKKKALEKLLQKNPASLGNAGVKTTTFYLRCVGVLENSLYKRQREAKVMELSVAHGRKYPSDGKKGKKGR